MTRQKVLVVGLDGGTWNILKPLAENGIMPTLGTLRATGVPSVLTSTIPPITPAAWSSFQTGLHPDRHGIFGFVNFDKNHNQLSLVNSQFLEQPTIWELAGDAGRQIITINVPMTYPPRPVNGIVVSGMLSPDAQSEFTYPPSIREDLLRQFGRYVFMKGQDVWHLTKDVERFTATMKEIVQFRLEVALWMAETYDWDLFMVHFQVVDAFQHPMWPYLDPQHPLFSRNTHAIVADFYSALDDAIAALNNAIDAQTKIIMSDHGFQRRRRNVLLNNWLSERGHLVYRQKGWRDTVVRSTYKAVRRLDVLNLRNRLISRELKANMLDFEVASVIDWDKTMVYATGGSVIPYVLFYLSNGISNEDDAFIRMLIQELSHLHDPRTNEPVIDWIVPASSIYARSGPTVPDVVAKLSPGYTMLPRLSEELFTDINSKQDYVIGTHDQNGIALFWGENIDATARLKHASIVDLAPTILYALETAVPDNLDGRVLQEVFQIGFRHLRQIQYREGIHTRKNNKEPHSYSQDEQQKVEERLRSLGYLD